MVGLSRQGRVSSRQRRPPTSPPIFSGIPELPLPPPPSQSSHSLASYLIIVWYLIYPMPFRQTLRGSSEYAICNGHPICWSSAIFALSWITEYMGVVLPNKDESTVRHIELLESLNYIIQIFYFHIRRFSKFDDFLG